jgi:hypothetical protein
MARLFGVALWLLAGLTAAGGIYWGFLNTPESTAMALSLSALLALAAVVAAAISVNGASLAWSQGWSGDVVRRAIAGVPAFVAAVLLGGVIWWLTARGLAWISTNSGRISAWFIASFGWADPSAFFDSVAWAGRWLQWVVGPLIALSLLGSMLVGEWKADRWRWLGRAVSPFRLTLATLWVALFVALPWMYVVPWRPSGLPATSIEVAFVAAKLAVVAVLMAIGVALVVRESVPAPPLDRG